MANSPIYRFLLATTSCHPFDPANRNLLESSADRIIYDQGIQLHINFSPKIMHAQNLVYVFLICSMEYCTLIVTKSKIFLCFEQSSGHT